MADKPKQHHYVPRTLLAGFTHTGKNTGKLFVVDLVRGSAYRTTLGTVGKERNYNLLEVDGLDPYAYETGFLANKVESPAGPVLEKLRRGGEPSKEDIDALLLFIAVQWLRVPCRRDAYNDFMSQAGRSLLHAVTANQEVFERNRPPGCEDLTLEELRMVIPRLQVRAPTSEHILNEINNLDLVCGELSKRSWTILDTPKGVDFVCTDNPVVFFPVGANAYRHYAVGLRTEGHAIFMPISRGKVLMGLFPEDSLGENWPVTQLEASTVRFLNSALIAHAARFVVSPEDNFSWMSEDMEVSGRADLIQIVKKSVGFHGK